MLVLVRKGMLVHVIETQEILLQVFKPLEAHHSGSHNTKVRDWPLKSISALLEGNNEWVLESPEQRENL